MVFHGDDVIKVGEQDVFPDLITVHRITMAVRKERVKARLTYWMDRLQRETMESTSDRASLIADMREAYQLIGRLT